MVYIYLLLIKNISDIYNIYPSISKVTLCRFLFEENKHKKKLILSLEHFCEVLQNFDRNVAINGLEIIGCVMIFFMNYVYIISR